MCIKRITDSGDPVFFRSNPCNAADLNIQQSYTSLPENQYFFFVRGTASGDDDDQVGTKWFVSIYSR